MFMLQTGDSEALGMLPWMRRRAYILSLVTIALLKLWLVSGVDRWPIGFAAYDDALFINLARSILDGHWLGPYNAVTLVKGPGYPLWIDIALLAGIPLWIADQLIYIAASALLVASIRPLLPSPGARAAIFAVLVFSPTTFSYDTLRYLRNPLSASLSMCVFAGLFGLITHIHDLRKFRAWAVLLGIALGALSITREESGSILPSVIAGYIWILVSLRREASVRRHLQTLVVPPVLFAACVLTVCTINRVEYGVFTVSELTRSTFVDAYSALLRVKHAHWRRWVPVPAETRARIYRVSPHFRELAPYLEGQMGQNWGTLGQESVTWDRDAMKREILGGFFGWAMRDSATLAGHHRTAVEAKKYYASIAKEVNDACAAGQLDCEWHADVLLSPWRSEYFALGIRTSWDVLVFLTTMDELFVGVVPSQGTPAQVQQFAEMSGDDMAPTVAFGQPVALPAIKAWKMTRLQNMAKRYQAMSGLASMFAAIVTLLSLTIPAWRRAARFLPFNLLMLPAAAAHIAIIAYLEMTALHIVHVLYLLPLYPLMILFWCFATADAFAIHSLIARRLSIAASPTMVANEDGR